MTDIDADKIRSIVAAVTVPGLDVDLGATRAGIEIKNDAEALTVALTLGFPAAGIADELARSVAHAVATEAATSRR